jgi:hypothetical protein
MTLPRGVAEAVASLDRWAITDFDGECSHADAWHVVSAHMLSQDAKIEQLRLIANVNGDWTLKYSQMKERAELAESRLAAANALLRDIRDWDVASADSAIHRGKTPIFALPLLIRESLQAYLQGAAAVPQPVPEDC